MSLPVALFCEFAFPLNVYAYAMCLEDGKADYLHYGLFQSVDESLLVAQLHSCDLLLERLPSPPCRILEVGIGLGTMLTRLHTLGYDVTGITPDSAQIRIAQEKTEAPLVCSRLEDFKAQPGSFDVVLFQESSQYIDPLSVFNQAFDLLAPGGQLFILDETLLQAVAYGREGLHSRHVMLDMALRFGFELIEQIDLSQAAFPTLDYLLRVVERHRQTLITDLGCSSEQLDALNASNRLYREKYASGRYGYSFLQFRKVFEPRWRLASGGENSREEILALFLQVFGQEMSPALWEWKYGAGRGSSVVARHGDKMVAHYGALARSALFFGEARTVVQIGDVMVHPAERGVLTKQGGFALVASTFFDLNVGFGTDYLASFGFPNERAMRLGKTLGLYGELDRMQEVTWPAIKTGPSWLLKLRLLGSDERAANFVEAAWDRMHTDLQGAIVGLRNWAYIKHRYIDHPVFGYDLLSVTARFSGRPIGVIVLKRDADRYELMDVIGALRDIPCLVLQARRWASCNGVQRLTAWVAESNVKLFAGNEATVQDIGVSVASNICRAGPSIEQMRKKWWLLTGDTDFK